MKRLLILAISALIGLNANAQVFVGGSIGYQYKKDGSTVENQILTASLQAANPSYTGAVNHGFNITPEVGYRFNDKWAAGVKLEYAPTFINYSTEHPEMGEATRKQRQDQASLGLFGRYTIWGINGFNICLQGELLGGYNYSKRSPTVYGNLLTAVRTPNDVSRGFTVEVTIFPMLTYDITKHLTAVAEFNILGFGYRYNKTTITTSVAYTEEKALTRDSVQSGNLISLNLNNKASLRFGIEYKF